MNNLRNIIIKIINTNNIINLRNFIEENNIKINTLNNKNFDVLIKSIENNASDLLIEFIIINGKYEDLNYTIFDKIDNKLKTPLSVAIEKNDFKIIELLIEYGANINYLDSKIFGNLLNVGNINFILNKGIKKNNLIQV